MGRCLILIGAVAMFAAVTSSAQPMSVAERTVEPLVSRLAQPIEFDGSTDDAAWQMVPPLPLARHWPTFGTELTERTDVRIGYDDTYLYVAARCFDSMPITETSYKRDDWSDQDDQLAIYIDTYDDHENALIFVMYPTGARIDAAVANDARTGDDISTDWNTFWETAVSRDEEGWYGEIRIPWSSLRFQPDADGRVTMGVGIYRYIARLNEMHVYPATPPDWGYWSFVKPSMAERLDFLGLTSDRPLYFSPYVIGGLGQDFLLNAAGTRFLRRDNPTYDAGFDLKYGITSNLTLDLSVNTDFAQVEADNQQINLTRFSLFFPEKRQFFLERTTNFDFSFGHNDRVFYSRRIGIHDGRVVQLLGGGRLVGRVGRWDVGLLAMQSARDHGLPSESFGVLRLKRQILNPNSYVGGIATSRLDFQGRYNTVYGLDGLFNVIGDEYLRVNWAQSFEPDSDAGPASLDNSRFRVLWQRAKEIGLAYEAGLSRSGEAYRPGIGFQLRHDFTQVSANVGIGWRSAESGIISKNVLALENSVYFRNADSEMETTQLGVLYSATLSRGGEASLGITHYFEDLIEGFSLSDQTHVAPGRYSYIDGMASWTTPAGRALRATVQLQGGGFFDGRMVSASVAPAWSISPKFEVSGTYGINRIRFAEAERAFDGHLLQARGDVMLSTRLTISSFVQYNSSIAGAIANVRLRINPREGNDFYLVYNEAFNTDRYLSDPALPISSSRTIIAKYTHTFIW